jgi:hypothetical protein
MIHYELIKYFINIFFKYIFNYDSARALMIWTMQPMFLGPSIITGKYSLFFLGMLLWGDVFEDVFAVLICCARSRLIDIHTVFLL